MKKILLLFLFMAGFISWSFAQQNNDEKIHALKVAYITERLQLTSPEAEKFWPVYNSYEGELKQVWNSKDSSDVLKREEKLLAIKKKYSSSFEKILGQDKTNKLFKTEQDFRNILIKRLRNRGSGPRIHK